MKTLTAETRARDVMSANPMSVNESASVREAAAFLMAKRVSAAPVINEAGRAVGVVTLYDIVRHSASADSPAPMEQALVTIMNDQVFFVRPETPLEKVVEDLLYCDVKRLFVADENDVLVGVITVTDVLRYLKSAADSQLAQVAYVTGRRPIPTFPRRPADVATAPSMEADHVMTAAI